MRKTWLACFALVWLAACGTASVGDAEKGVAAFHRQLDAGDFATIWRSSGQEMKSAASQADFQKLLEAVHTKLGKVKSATRTGWRVNTTTNGNFAILAYETEFANGKATETFTFKQEGEQAKLVGYNINSLDLMTK